MQIIVGLGNPGQKYEKTRHNAGWIFIDNLAHDCPWQENKKFQAMVCKKQDIMFIKPLTYMNNSGKSIKKVLNYYHLIPKKLGIINKKNQDLSDFLTVIHDELDLDFNVFKIAKNSGSAGHKGIQSIISALKTKNFKRLRIGIKNELLKTKLPPEKFVLQNFKSEELEILKNKAFNYSSLEEL